MADKKRILEQGDTFPTPSNLEFKDYEMVSDIKFHPSADYILSGFYSGNVRLHSYSLPDDEDNAQVLDMKYQENCRTVDFLPDGEKFYTTSENKTMSVVDLEAEKIIHTFQEVNNDPVHSVFAISNQLIATGDQEGVLKLWDLRKNKSVMSLHKCGDYISEMVMQKERTNILVASSGDGSISAFDIRKHKVKVQSEYIQSELQCMVTMWNDTQIVAGSDRGDFLIYNWGEFGASHTGFGGHKTGIECMVAIDKEILCTADIHGAIRAVHVSPCYFVGLVAKHKKTTIDRLRVSHCGGYMASSAQDHLIRFYNLDYVDKLQELPQKKRLGFKKKSKKARVNVKNINKRVTTAKASFFDNMEDEDQFAFDKEDVMESDDDEDSDNSNSDNSDSDNSDIHNSNSDNSDIDNSNSDISDLEDSDLDESFSDESFTDSN